MTNLLSNPDFALPADSPNPLATYLTVAADDRTGHVEEVNGGPETAAKHWSHGGSHNDRSSPPSCSPAPTAAVR